MKVHIDDFNKNVEYYLNLVKEINDFIEIYSDSGFSMKISLEKENINNDKNKRIN